jgi:Arc/MetJ-type ribon-helix-helix transcriptional regulator
MNDQLPRSVAVDLPADVETLIAAHEAPDEGSVWTTVIHGALWEMRARDMGREAVRRELAEELQATLDSGSGEEATPEWWKQFRARCEEDHRRIDEAQQEGLLGNLLLPDKLYDFVTAEIAAGRFASATDLVTEAVRKCSWQWERDVAAG